jgi:hypothetical protein
MTERQPAATYHIRRARPDDEPFLTAMLELASNCREPGPGQTPNPVDKNMPTGSGAAVISALSQSATAGGHAGAAWCRLLSGADRGYGYVADDIPEVALAVSPEHAALALAPGSSTR